MTWLVMSSYGVTRCQSEDVPAVCREHQRHVGCEFVVAHPEAVSQ